MAFNPHKVSLEKGDVFMPAWDEKAKFTAQESGTYFVCTCSKSNAYPFCDGAHIALNKATEGTVEASK
jgi:CDGSH-type Zn-finger protein